MNAAAITDKGEQKRIDRRASALAEQHKRDLLAVLGTAEGRRVLWHVIDDLAGLYGYSLAGNNLTFISEGRRSVGGELVRELQQASVELYVQMTREAIQRGYEREFLMKGGAAQRDDDNGD